MALLVNIPGVELAEVGENWMASTGTVTFTPADLAAAVEAQNDPAIRPPILKFGHVDSRGMELDKDGEPAVGTVQNLRLSDNGMTLLGDYVGVPEWLATAMPSAYPRRSIEACFNWKTNTGHTHQLALSAVALLGTKYPAITTLEDIQAVFAAESIDQVSMVDADELVAASHRDGAISLTKEEPMKEVKAAVLLETVRRKYYESLDGSDRWDMWIRQTQLEPNALIVSDDGNGGVYSVEFTVNGEDVVFAEPIEVTETYVPVKVAASSGPREIVKYATKQISYRDTVAASGQTEESSVTPEQKKQLGLAENATEEEVNARIAELATLAASQAGADADKKESETPDPNTGGEDNPGKPETEQPAAPTAPQVPEGSVLVDATIFQEMKERLTRVEASNHTFSEERRINDRATKISAAIKDGRIAPARKEAFEKLYDADPEGTTTLLSSFEPGLIPVEKEMGHGTDVSLSGEEFEYDPSFLTPAERARIEAAKKGN